MVLRVRDGHGGLALQSFQIQVNSLNTAPIITSNPDLDTVVNLPYQYQIQAQDADGDPLTFRLDTAPTGVTLDATTGILRWTPINSQVGQHTFTLIASDDKGEKPVKLIISMYWLLHRIIPQKLPLHPVIALL